MSTSTITAHVLI